MHCLTVFPFFLKQLTNGDYSHTSLNDGDNFEKCVVRQFCYCGNIIQCTYTNLGSIAHYTPSLYGIAYCS
jgi:hypothetical protein